MNSHHRSPDEIEAFRLAQAWLAKFNVFVVGQDYFVEFPKPNNQPSTFAALSPSEIKSLRKSMPQHIANATP